jgi:hypothetical protein
MEQKPVRAPWGSGFPAVLIQAPRREVTTHPWFAAARTGDVDAAALLVADTVSGDVTDRLAELGLGRDPILASVHALGPAGVSVLAEVLAQALRKLLGWETDTELVQANIVDHPGDIGFGHLARQAVFAGGVQAGRTYILVDDFIGQGGTLANLRGHILRGGGQVAGATVLTGAWPRRHAGTGEQAWQRRTMVGTIFRMGIRLPHCRRGQVPRRLARHRRHP